MNGRAWTPDDDALLRARYADAPTVDLARRLGRSLPATSPTLSLRRSRHAAGLATTKPGIRLFGANSHGLYFLTDSAKEITVRRDSFGYMCMTHYRRDCTHATAAREWWESLSAEEQQREVDAC